MVLMSNEQNEKLLKLPWIVKRSEGRIYYMKYTFETPHEYTLLFTDLCLVWFEHGNHERMRENAENEFKMELGTAEDIDNLLEKVKIMFKKKALRCRLQRTPGHIKILLPLEEKQVDSDITSVAWMFDCRRLDSETEKHGWFNGPQVLFQHFILPSQIVVNHFVQNVMDESTEQLKVGPEGPTFIQDSLDYMTSLANKNKANGLSVAQGLMVEQVGEDERERLRLEAKEEEELKRKRELEEYNLRLQQQRGTSTTKKKRRI